MKLKAAVFFITVIGALALFVGHARALDDIRVDSRCSAYLISKPYEDVDNDPSTPDKPLCNLTCTVNCTQQTPPRSCPFENPDPGLNGCISIDDTKINEGLGHWNFFGVDFGTPVEAIPRLVRILLTGIFSVIALVAILLGVYAMYVRTTAGDNAEKAELSLKITRNAIIGIIIAFMGVAIVQVVALLLGMTGGLFDFNLIPNPLQRGRALTSDQAKEACNPEGTLGYTIDTGGTATLYNCQGGKWVITGTLPTN